MLCHDCPKLSKDGMPADWRPRLMCCSDERQLRERAEQEAHAAAAKVANDRPNRAARRRAAKTSRHHGKP
jgi:hypothetical protein